MSLLIGVSKRKRVFLHFYLFIYVCVSFCVLLTAARLIDLYNLHLHFSKNVIVVLFFFYLKQLFWFFGGLQGTFVRRLSISCILSFCSLVFLYRQFNQFKLVLSIWIDHVQLCTDCLTTSVNTQFSRPNPKKKQTKQNKQKWRCSIWFAWHL